MATLQTPTNDDNQPYKLVTGSDVGTKRGADTFPITDFSLAVSMGLIPGHSFIQKFGENSDVDTGPAEDIWDFGGAYSLSTSAIIDSISSSNNADTMDIVVEGLTTGHVASIQTVTLQGQTRVALSPALIRVNRKYMVGNVTVAGNVYTYENTAISGGTPTDTTKIRSQLKDGNNQTLMAVYTVPANITGYLYNYYVGISREKTAVTTADFSLRVALFGEKFRMRARVGVTNAGTSIYQHNYKFPIMLPEKTDVKIRCQSVSANSTAVLGGFDVLLIDD